MTTNFKTVQAQDFQLSGSGCVIGATSITLKSFTDIDGITLLAMTDFGAIGFATIEPGNGTQEEQISFTGVTQNLNGTATLTGVSNVNFLSPYTTTSGTLKSHAGSTTLIITNTSGFYDQFPNKANDEVITGQWTFSVFPITPATPDASATVKGMTKLSIAPTVANNPIAVGANDLSSGTNIGITKLSIAPVSASNPIAVGDNDSRVPVAYAIDSVGTDSYAITPSPAITAYVEGQHFIFKAGTANSGACSLNVSALGAKTIKKNVSTDLATGDILLNQVVEVVYDGTNMQLVSPIPVIFPNKYTNGVTTKNMADASTTQTIAHGMGVIPNIVNFSAIYTVSKTISMSFGTYTGTQNSCVYQTTDAGAGNVTLGNSTTYAIRIQSTDGNTYQSGVVTVDITNITITWTKVGSPSGAAEINWSAQY